MATVEPGELYTQAIDLSKPENYSTLGLGARFVAWLTYKFTGFGGNETTKAQALFDNMQSALEKASNDTEKRKIAAKYGQALGAARKALETGTSTKVLEAFQDRIQELASRIIKGSEHKETASVAGDEAVPPPAPRPIIQLHPSRRIANAQARGTVIELQGDLVNKTGSLIATMKGDHFETDTPDCYFNIAATIISLPDTEPDKVLEAIFSKESGIPPTRLLLLAEALCVGKNKFQEKIFTLIKAFVGQLPPGEAKQIRDIIGSYRKDVSVGTFYDALYKMPPPPTAPKPMLSRTSPNERLQSPETKGIGAAHTQPFENEKDKFIADLKAAILEQSPDCYFTLSEIFKEKPPEIQETILETVFNPANGIPFNRILLFTEAVASKYPETQNKIIDLFRNQLTKAEWESIRTYLASNQENHPLAEMYKAILHNLPPTMPPRSAPSEPESTEEEQEEASSSEMPAPPPEEIPSSPPQSMEEELRARLRAQASKKRKPVAQPQAQVKKELSTLPDIEGALASQNPPYAEIKDALLRLSPIVYKRFLNELRSSDPEKYKAIGIALPDTK